MDIVGEFGDRLVPACAFLSHSLEWNPFQFSVQTPGECANMRTTVLGDAGGSFAKMCHPSAWGSRVLIPDDIPYMLDATSAKHLTVKRQGTGQQLIEQHAEGIDVRTRVDVPCRHVCLFGTHVLRGSYQLSGFSKQCSIGRRLADGLGDAEVYDLGDRLIALHVHQDIRGLEIPMNDALLVGMLNAFAYVHEQLQSLFNAQFLAIAVLRDGQAVDVLHREVGPTLVGGSCIVHLGDVGMVQQSQRLALCLETRDYLFGVHAGFDYLHRHAPANGVFLLSQIYDTHAPFIKNAQDLVSLHPRHSGQAGRLRSKPADGRHAVRFVFFFRLHVSLSIAAQMQRARVNNSTRS